MKKKNNLIIKKKTMRYFITWISLMIVIAIALVCIISLYNPPFWFYGVFGLPVGHVVTLLANKLND